MVENTFTYQMIDTTAHELGHRWVRYQAILYFLLFIRGFWGMGRGNHS